MRIEDVKKLTPFDRLVHWISERESIRLKRLKGEPPPWTTDEILQKFRFTCVRRMDDHVSQWLLKNWYTPYKDHPNMLRAAALARFFNLPSTLDAVTDLVFADKWDGNAIISKIRALKKKGTVFNSAYMVRGNDGPDKIKSVVTFNVAMLAKAKVVIDPSSMENTWAAITPVYGFGSFMAGQIVADLRWAVTGSWADKSDWAPIGPGSQRGMNLIHGAKITVPISQETFVAELKSLTKRLKVVLPTSITDRMEAIDWQNTLCETAKYHRTLFGEGRPKERYDPIKPKYGDY